VSQLRLKAITFKAGAGPGRPPLELQLATVCIFVGPNNSGKSQALREIERWSMAQNEERKVIDTLSAEYPANVDDAWALIERFRAAPPQGNIEAPEHIWVGQHTFRSDEPVVHFQVHEPGVRQHFEAKNEEALRSYLMRLYTVRLDGRTRFLLSDPKPSGDLQLSAQNHLWALFRDDSARIRVRNLTEEAFGLHFTVDPRNKHSTIEPEPFTELPR
jgi:hypothetical protein